MDQNRILHKNKKKSSKALLLAPGTHQEIWYPNRPYHVYEMHKHQFATSRRSKLIYTKLL